MTLIEYKISFTWSDGTPRTFPTWDEIHSHLLDKFGSSKAAYTCYTAYVRERDGWELSSFDKLYAATWRAKLEECFLKFSRPACAVIIVRKLEVTAQ